MPSRGYSDQSAGLAEVALAEADLVVEPSEHAGEELHDGPGEQHSNSATVLPDADKSAQQKSLDHKEDVGCHLLVQGPQEVEAHHKHVHSSLHNSA